MDVVINSQKINTNTALIFNLQNQIDNIVAIIGDGNLENVLTNGNSAGTNDIDMSGNDILQVNNIDLTTINGNAYPPAGATLQDVLTNGNTGAGVSIILNDTITPTQTNTLSSGGINLTKTDGLSEGNIFWNNTDFTISTNNNLVLTADNIDLSADGTLIVPSLANDAYLRYSHTTANQQLYSSKSNSGGGFPMLSLFQDNTSIGSANLRFQKNTTAVNSPLGEIAFYGRSVSAGNPYREFARIKTAIRNNTAPSNIDGSIDFLTLVNGSLTELMRLNGQNSEIEFYQPLDLNNNAIKTATGNMELNSTASTGTGDITLNSKNNVSLQATGGAGSRIFASANAEVFINSLDNNVEVNADKNVNITSTSGVVNVASGINLNSTQNINLTSTGAGSSIKLLSTSNVDIEATGDNLSLTAGTTTLFTTPVLEFVGAGLQSNTAGGNSGEHLVITLNGVQYKIKLELA